ncbi:hypothetical protein LOC67_23385 [Stieleria sp. JC731]|uniref:hypothetical protein n=1 Tax=Pirellulaceae TaxID=2691357 RepID=UPI001E5043EC|nr:hypothetical protein [Stieleria sp. JC731]MCC9603503.1 hypothetical protein [Stieleria sp. JC731]
MSYQPNSGSLSNTDLLVRKLASGSATWQSILGVSNLADAIEKGTVYSRENMGFPRLIVSKEPVQFETDTTGNIMGVSNRVSTCGFFMYSPTDDDMRALGNWTGGASDPVTDDDRFTWASDQLSKILFEMLEISGSAGNVHVSDPVIYDPEKVPWSERPDSDEIELGNDARSLWYGIIDFTVL